MRYSTILVPVDDTPLAEQALDTALGLASQWGSALHAVWVRPEPGAIDDAHADLDYRDVEDKTRHLRAMLVERAQPRHPEVVPRLQAHVLGGSPVSAIVDAARELRADLIVMGTHGRQGIIDHIAGSTTERVMMSTAATVLVVKPDGFPASA